jgi:methylamine dehydrogenase accessory protein MauD
MHNFLIVSNVLLWLSVISLLVIVFALLRQVGVLYERVAPAGALMINQKLSPGDKAPQMSVTDINEKKALSIGGLNEDNRSQLLFFLDRQCPVCKTLLPLLKSSQAAEKNWLDIVLVGDSDKHLQQQFIKQFSLERFSFINSDVLGKAYGVAKLPFAVLINSKGVISSMGLVNSREHLESLFEAQERSVSSIQAYLQQNNSVVLEGGELQ